MALQIKTIRGRKYVYDVKSFWDKEQKKYRKRTVYMGPCLNEETKEYAPKKANAVKACGCTEHSGFKSEQSKQIVRYGDAHLLWECFKKSKLFDALKKVLPPFSDSFLAMVFYKIIEGDASCHAASWLEGSFAKIIFPNADLASQRISELLGKLGSEHVQRAFFKRYITEIAVPSGEVVIDSTGLENEIDIPLTEYSGKSEKSETKLIMVIDRVTRMPLYFRLVAGNIIDVSTLTTTFRLAKNFGLNPAMTVMDAGYYSSDNIKALGKAKISFLSRLPAGRKLYNESILQTKNTIENPENIVFYNNRSLYIQKVKVDLYGYTGYAYVCQDIKEMGKRRDRFLKTAKDDKLTNDEITQKMPFIGKFVLVSNKDLNPEELLPLYYARQKAEAVFGFSKSKLDILPLRVHSAQNLKGYIFLSYIALLLSLEIQNSLKDLCTLEEALKLGQNHYCEIFDHEIIPLEPNRRIKEIYKCLGVW